MTSVSGASLVFSRISQSPGGNDNDPSLMISQIESTSQGESDLFVALIGIAPGTGCE